jgi:hypothetical protein
VAAVLTWFGAVSWPRLAASGRLLRGAAIAIVIVGATIQFVSLPAAISMPAADQDGPGTRFGSAPP